MQASKIMPGSTYAIRSNDNGDKLQRFVVTAVTTRRVSAHGNPHDYHSSIEGYVQHPDAVSEAEINGKALVLAPDRILGRYEEFAELTARKDAEQAAKKAESDAVMASGRALWSLLHDKLGLPPSGDPTNFKNSIRLSHNGGGVEINRGAVKLLTDYLKQKE